MTRAALAKTMPDRARETPAATGTELEIEILGERRSAKVIAESPYDPENRALKA